METVTDFVLFTAKPKTSLPLTIEHVSHHT